VTTLYNFQCYPEHVLIVGVETKTVVSSLGHYIPKYARKENRIESVIYFIFVAVWFLFLLICIFSCVRIAERDPYTDILFGSGYGTERAKRYEWLLTLKERIPDEDVEMETDKYWARQREKERNETKNENAREEINGYFLHPTNLQFESS
jgi:hypothetical protein